MVLKIQLFCYHCFLHMNSRILLVDLQSGSLAARATGLGTDREVVIFTNPDEAIALLRQSPPFTVVLCASHAPDNDGIAFLAAAFEHAPKTVRILLASREDTDLVFEAINRDHIFAFLANDCSAESFLNILESAEKQYATNMIEAELLEKTLSGSLQLLTEVLAMAAPKQFSRSQQLREYMQHLAAEMKVASMWELETAAMLAPLGYVTLPPALLKKLNAAEDLTSDEQQIVVRLPGTTSKLISHLPRLEGVAEMIRYQNKDYNGKGFPNDGVLGDKIPLGGRILKVLNDLLDLEAKKKFKPTALAMMRENFSAYDLTVLDAAHVCFVTRAHTPDMDGIKELSAADIKVGQLLMDNVNSKDGLVLLPAASRISKLGLERLRNFAELGVLKEPLYVK